LWAIANFGPHLLVYLIFRQPYFALPFYIGTPVEVGLLALNLLLPLWWLRRRGIGWREGLAWHWEGGRTWRWGLGGLAVLLVWGWVVGLLIPVPGSASSEGQGYPFPQVLLVLLGLLALWVAAIAGEEGMFRGWMQTQLDARGPAWVSILLPALLFGLRHLPLDLYSGHAGLAGWAARLLELYSLALLMSLIRWRTGSIAPTVVLHGGLWWLVIFGQYGTTVGAVIGVGIGVVIAIFAALKHKR
jgi:membrane protease YdiL (CAAX protease family)